MIFCLLLKGHSIHVHTHPTHRHEANNPSRAASLTHTCHAKDAPHPTITTDGIYIIALHLAGEALRLALRGEALRLALRGLRLGLRGDALRDERRLRWGGGVGLRERPPPRRGDRDRLRLRAIDLRRGFGVHDEPKMGLNKTDMWEHREMW